MSRSARILLSIVVILLVSVAAKLLVFDTVLEADPDSGRQRVTNPQD